MVLALRPTPDNHRKIPQLGRVVVEDDVEIGPNATVDRGTIDETRIGENTKIDNLVMIAHGVNLGHDSLLVGQAGIAGSARVGARATIAGQSGVSGHLELGEGVVVAAKSAVFGRCRRQAGFVAGIPAVDHRAGSALRPWRAGFPMPCGRLRELQARIDALEARDS